jgi:hypothetical protein
VVGPQTDPPTPLGKRLQCDTTTGCKDFTIGSGDTEVHMKITSTKVLLYIDDAHGDGPWLACFDRQYTGPFDTISFGVGPGCERDPTTGACIEDRHCVAYGQPGQNAYYPVIIDTLSVLGGELAYAEPPPPPVGACCYGNGECVEETDQDTCETVLGGRYDGNGSQCGDQPCCPKPFADPDRDNDVDQEDFAVFQACFTGAAGGVPAGCECFDRDSAGAGDGDIDEDDWDAFQLCATGPEVLLDWQDPGTWPAGCEGTVSP